MTFFRLDYIWLRIATGNLWCWLSRDVFLSTFRSLLLLFLGTLKEDCKILQFLGTYPWENLNSDHEKGSKNWPILATFLQSTKKSCGKPLVLKPTVFQYLFPMNHFFLFSQIFEFSRQKSTHPHCLKITNEWDFFCDFQTPCIP